MRSNFEATPKKKVMSIKESFVNCQLSLNQLKMHKIKFFRPLWDFYFVKKWHFLIKKIIYLLFIFIFQSLSNDYDEPKVKVKVGICAMEKKSLSKPMREILSRIEEFEYIETIIFPEHLIVNVSIYLTFFLAEKSAVCWRVLRK